MNHDFLLNFLALDKTAFTQLMKHLGYASAACYRLKNQKLVFLIGSDLPDGKTWPACISFHNKYYNSKRKSGLPLGWAKPLFPSELKSVWPKGIISYFPEQDLCSVKLVLFLKPAIRRNLKEGDLSGPLEAIYRRISLWLDNAEIRNFINETAFHEHIRNLSLDSQALIDHDLRTPLTVINGYARVVEEWKESVPEAGEISNIIVHHTSLALKAIEKLAESLKGEFSSSGTTVEIVDLPLLDLTKDVIASVKSGLEASEFNALPLDIGLVCPHDEEKLIIHGDKKMMSKAIEEVLQNAIRHSGQGRIEVALYRSDENAILDIVDDGEGIPLGSEELIFLRFFQAPTSVRSKRGHRGLGLGLYLARQIAEQHGGQLVALRKNDKGALFRFIWPLSETALKGNNENTFKRTG